MKCTKYYYYVIVFVFTVNYNTLIGSAIRAGSWYKWNTITNNICRFKECCDSNYVLYDVEKLNVSFSERMFGQPLVTELVDILTAQKKAMLNKTNKKPLVISLNGWVGVGKNFAARIIAEALYRNGMQSKYVKLFMGREFDCIGSGKNIKEVISQISVVVKKCPRSLIIFDNVYDRCPSAQDALKYMTYLYHVIDGVDFRDTIFLLISNLGSSEISKGLLDLHRKGIKRNSVEFRHFDAILRSVYNKALIQYNLIDHFIAFLPLERDHVAMCALEIFRMHEIFAPSKEMISDILSKIKYEETFAPWGCKRLNKLVPYNIHKYKRKTEL